MRMDCDDPFFLWCLFLSLTTPPLHPGRGDQCTTPGRYRYRRGARVNSMKCRPHYRGAYEDMALSSLHGSIDLTDDELREQIALIYGIVSSVNHETGRVLEALEARGVQKDTLSLFTSDHGDMRSDHWLLRRRLLPLRGLLCIPAIWSWSDEHPKGMCSDGLTSAIDVVPTIWTSVTDRSRRHDRLNTEKMSPNRRHSQAARFGRNSRTTSIESTTL